MSDDHLMIALGLGCIALVLFYCAWREAANKNQRDAKILAAFGVGGTLGLAVLLT
jgi:hypothetical protein